MQFDIDFAHAVVFCFLEIQLHFACLGRYGCLFRYLVVLVRLVIELILS